tara:strand:- start:439 stop:789 length:351 start_codon:yes stop_codon:yes gene_type:complete
MPDLTTDQKTEIATNSLRGSKCSEDYVEWCKAHNRHRLTISLVNEQRDSNEQYFDPIEITFFNEDNAIEHFSLLDEFLDLITAQENQTWGYPKRDNTEVVERVLNPIKDRLLGRKV